MPHAEYPSASACVCQAWADALSLHSGTDDVTGVIGGPLVLSKLAFSSIYEPLSTPSENLLYFYSSFSQISQRCGDSRVEGGMHFSESVPAGRDLCQNIGAKAVEYVEKLVSGVTPDYVVDFYDTSVVERDCYPETESEFESDSGDSSESSDSSDSS